MECYQIDEELLESLTTEIHSINVELLKLLNGKKQILNSVEFIKISFSESILEDIVFLNGLSGNKSFRIRHANIIIRDMLEQVIEFIYLMKHEEKIYEYLGLNIDETSLSEEEPVEAIKKLGKQRFTGGRKSVFFMAKDIGEAVSTLEQMALYDLYRILSEMCHSSYYFAGLDDCEEIETGNAMGALTEEQVLYLTIIIDRFMNCYRKQI